MNNQTNQLEPFLPPNRDPIEFVLTEASTRGWGTGLVQDLPKPYDAILKTVPRGVPIPSTRPKFVLGNFIPATINPEESPIHHLILDFFDCCWRDMKTIGKYYHPHAVFSATMDVDVDNMIPRFKSFNRDYCDNHVKMGPVAVGPIEISQRLCDLFGPGFYAHPTSYVFNLFMPECCGLVVHGAFQVDEGKKSYVYCFDRSFLIGVVDNGIFIINDHIFIRTAKLPGSL
ncbi:hypothetical protein TRFO_05240 [Tritrichomonas foetus]|uniref:Nuclear transport factor 2 domain-containing protein n=1 Tax=Tritrichomonas foetus TaxID=1144522 RepID=A0A1J4K7W8_9EUKA|nr:hypothetical protein TRFO_05240 [Tritrichomonas foetus]|eukprot:OHT07585.1 hypothetical protein TRFO_05240 [Tritrichomonas foetus]